VNHLPNIDLTGLLMKMFDNSSEAIFFFDEEGTIISLNEAAKLILDEDVLHRMIDGEQNAFCQSCKGFTSEQEIQTCTSCYMQNPTRDFSSFQVFLDTKGQGVIPYSASYQVIDESSGTRSLTLRHLTTQFKTQETLNQKLTMKNIIKAQEDERKRLSRELHDGVAQEMLSSLVDLRVMKYMNINEDVLKKVQQTEGSLMRLLDDIRHMSVELRPATLDDLGLEAAFRTHFKWVEKSYGFVVRFTAELSAKRYTGEVETVVYRVCQEAVFNSMKYANTEEVTVRLFEEAGHLKLNVLDDGLGFDMNDVKPKGTGLGLYGMKERAELVGGRIFIKSKPGRGTDVTIEIPLSEGGSLDENHNSR
jgi:two-component system sensor histidine kinase NreB